MPEYTLHILAERMRQTRAAFVRELGSSAASAASAERRIGLALTPGARVFDRVSGLEGEILGGTRENLIVPSARRPNG
jgi:hypothetical protein